MLRINESIKKNISSLLLREIEDPRIRNNFVTITRVDTAKDLKEAKVYFSCLEEDRKEEVLAGLKCSKGVIFSMLRKMLTIRYTPNLTFYFDKQLMETNRVLEQIHKLNIPKLEESIDNNIDNNINDIESNTDR